MTKEKKSYWRKGKILQLEKDKTGAKKEPTKTKQVAELKRQLAALE